MRVYTPVNGSTWNELLLMASVLDQTYTEKELTEKKNIKDKKTTNKKGQDTLKDQKKVSIKKVIYHNPAVIVFWSDNTKTVSICHQKDTFNPDAGLAICIAKKWIGNEAFHLTLEKYKYQVNNTDSGEADSLEKVEETTSEETK